MIPRTVARIKQNFKCIGAVYLPTSRNHDIGLVVYDTAVPTIDPGGRLRSNDGFTFLRALARTKQCSIMIIATTAVAAVMTALSNKDRSALKLRVG